MFNKPSPDRDPNCREVRLNFLRTVHGVAKNSLANDPTEIQGAVALRVVETLLSFLVGEYE